MTLNSVENATDKMCYLLAVMHIKQKAKKMVQVSLKFVLQKSLY
jgi:hypothetical protein